MFAFDFTQQHLQDVIGNNRYIAEWHTALSKICPDYGIDTPKRLAAFLAQCSHESGGFRILKENLNYRAESLMRTWPSRFPTLAFAQQYARQPEKIANFVYANRIGNGPAESGDGWRYIGRGLIQLTGRENYSWFAASIETPVDEIPDYLETFEGAVQSACWFWITNNLNSWVDKDDFDGLSDVINRGRKTEKYGDAIGFADRLKYYNLALKVLGA
jgi:putative chitinase